MKKIFLFLLLPLVFACDKEDTRNDNNPNLIDPIINLTLNLNLPQYNGLNFPGNSVVLTQQGIKGIVIYNVNNTTYNAFELTDPNHPPNDCSRMILDGVIASCPCDTDANEYNIVSGLHTTNEGLYPMQPYFVTRTGNTIRISN